MSRKGLNIYKRKDNRWEGRYYQQGTKKYHSVYGRSYAEAREKLQALCQQQSAVEQMCDFSFNAVLLQWLEGVRIQVKESTYANYYSKLHLHILPFFQGVRYNAVTSNLVEQFMQEKLKAGFSGKYVSDMVILIKSAVRWAVKNMSYLNRLTKVVPPRARSQEPILLTAEQQKQLLAYLQLHEDRTAIAVYLAIYVGLRIGEICALQWQDLDFSENTLHVTKTIQRYTDHNSEGEGKTVVQITAPKTENAYRTIPLPLFLAEKLCELQENDTDFILTGTDRPMEPRCLTFRFQKILQRAGVPSVKFHSLRHSFATNCLQQNFDIKTLSEILGHAKMETTMRTYVHSSMEQKRICMERIDAIS